MKLGQWLFLLVMAFVVFSVVFVMRSAKNMYRALPATLETSIPSLPFEEWRQFHSQNGKFTAYFPALPQHATETIKEPKSGNKRLYDMYVSQKNDGTLFMISLITYTNPQEVASPSGLFKTITSEMMAANPNNVLKLFKEGAYEKYPAMDFSIENDEVHMDGKSFLIDNTLYILSYIAKLPQYSAAEYQHFVDSFELSSAQKPSLKETPSQ